MSAAGVSALMTANTAVTAVTEFTVVSSMNYKTTILMLALLALVGGVFLYTQMTDDPPPTDTSQEGPAPLIPDAAQPAGQLTRLTIKRGGETLVFEQDRDQWWQREPVDWPADGRSIERLARGLLTIQSEKTLQAGEDGAPSLDEALLTPDTAAARVTMRFYAKSITGEVSQSTLELAFGKRITGGRGFVRLGRANQLHLAADDYHQLLADFAPRQWRVRSLAGFDLPAAAQAVRIERQGPDVNTVLKRDADRWYLLAPWRDRAAFDAVEALLHQMRHLSVKRFIADTGQLSEFGLDGPNHGFAVTAPDGVVHNLRIGSSVEVEGREHVYLHLAIGRPGEAAASGATKAQVVFAALKRDVDALFTPDAGLLDPALVDLSSTDVASVFIQHPDEQFRIVWDASGRRTLDAPGETVDTDAVQRLIDALDAARAAAFTDQPRPDSRPIHIITLNLHGQAPPRVLRFYLTPDEQAPKRHDHGLPIPIPLPPQVARDRQKPAPHWTVYLDDEANGRIVPHTQLAPVVAPRLALLDTTLWRLEERTLDTITIAGPGGRTFRFVHDTTVAPPRNWRLDGPRPADALTMQRLIDTITELRAERWLSGRPTPGDDWFTVTISTESATRDLQFDPATGKAVATGIERGFVLPDTTRELLAGEFRSLTLLPLAPAQVRRITVTDPGRPAITLTRRGPNVEAAGLPEGAILDQDRAVALFAALSPLRAGQLLADAPTDPPVRTLRITTIENKTHTVTLAEHAALVDGTPATLEAPTGDALRASLLRDAP